MQHYIEEPTSNRRRPSAFVHNSLCAFLLGCVVPQLWAGTATEPPSARLERVYREARARFMESNSTTEACWQLGRATFDVADQARTDSDRAIFAREGIAACRSAIARKYSCAPAHYYLAMNLGQLARTESIGALKLVREMESEFKTAIEIDEKFDYAGAHRSLGLLYKDAPGWPTSIGSRSKARQHLRRANELCRDYPDNRLSMAEAYLDWGETKLVTEELPSLAETLETARSKLTGEEWTLSWRDWDARFQRIQTKAGNPARRATSPRSR